MTDTKFITTRLPSAYTELLYIQSDGASYIDTGVIPNLATTDVEFACNDYETDGYGCQFGAYSNNLNYYTLYNQNKTSVNLRFGSIQSTTAKEATDVFNVIEYKSNNIYLDGELVGTNTQTGSLTHSVPLFARWTSTDYTYYSNKLKISYCKFWDNNTLVRNFIPALKKSTNEVGMYDTVTCTFYENAGTGTFTAGPEINTISKIEIADKELQQISLPVSTLENGKYQVLEYITNNEEGTNNYIKVKGSVYDDGSAKTVVYDSTYSLVNVTTRQIMGYEGTQTNHYFGVQKSHSEIGQTNTGINTKVTLYANTKYTYRTKYYAGTGVNTELWVYDENGDLLPDGYNSNNAYLGNTKSSLFIFRCSWTGGGCLTGAKFYGSKVWFDDELKGELIPCKRISDGVYGVYNLVDQVFWEATGSVSGGSNSTIDLPFWTKAPEIPSNYTQVSYLENTSGKYAETGGGASANVGSYINTGINPKPNGIVKMKLQFNEYTGSANPYQCLFGGYDANARNFGIVVQEGTTYYMDGGQSNDTTFTWNYDGSTDYEIEYSASGKYLIQNGTKHTFSAGPLLSNSDLSIYLFTDNSVGSGMTGYDTTYTLMGKIYYFQYYEGTELKMDLVPAVRKSDSVAGMYDKIQDKFFTNVGNGTFSYG